MQAEEVPTEEMQKNIPDGMPENEESPEDALHEETDDTAAGENNKTKNTCCEDNRKPYGDLCGYRRHACSRECVYRRSDCENTELEKENSIRKIFGSYITAEEYTDFESPEEMYVYLVYKSNMLYGYCVNVFPSGFGGQINMMVGIGADSDIAGVNIVSMSETRVSEARRIQEIFFPATKERRARSRSALI